MDILAALSQEEAKWKKQASMAQQQLDTVARNKRYRFVSGHSDGSARHDQAGA